MQHQWMLYPTRAQHQHHPWIFNLIWSPWVWIDAYSYIPKYTIHVSSPTNKPRIRHMSGSVRLISYMHMLMHVNIPAILMLVDRSTAYMCSSTYTRVPKINCRWLGLFCRPRRIQGRDMHGYIGSSKCHAGEYLDVIMSISEAQQTLNNTHTLLISR
jgi:hypothetical protein